MKNLRLLIGIVFLTLFVASCENASKENDFMTKETVSIQTLTATGVDYYPVWSPAGGAATECAAAGSSCTYSFKVEGSAPNGNYSTLSGAVIHITNSDGYSFDWSITGGAACAVIVKAGRGAYVYNYNPAATSDVGLTAPGGKQISHVTFCFGATPNPMVIAFKGQVLCGNGSAWSLGNTVYSTVGFYPFVYSGTAGKVYLDGNIATPFGDIIVGNFDSDALLEVKITNTDMPTCKFYNQAWLFVGTLSQYITAGAPGNYPYQQNNHPVQNDFLIFDLPF